MTKEQEVKELSDILKQSADRMRIGEDSTESVAKYLIGCGYSRQKKLVPLDEKEVCECLIMAAQELWKIKANLTAYTMLDNYAHAICKKFGQEKGLNENKLWDICDSVFPSESLVMTNSQMVRNFKAMLIKEICTKFGTKAERSEM